MLPLQCGLKDQPKHLQRHSVRLDCAVYEKKCVTWILNLAIKDNCLMTSTILPHFDYSKYNIKISTISF